MQTKTTTTASTQRLIAKVLRDLVAVETFASYADLKDALRCRLVRLRIRRYPQADFDDAITVVGSNVTLVHRPLVPRALPPPDVAPVDRDTAAAILGRLGAVIRTMDTTAADDAHARRVRDQAALVQAAVYRGAIRAKRRPIRERLDAIFGPEPSS